MPRGPRSRKDEFLLLYAAVLAFDALPGIVKAERLDAGDPVAKFCHGRTRDPRDQGHVVAGSVDHYGVAAVCPLRHNGMLRPIESRDA